MISLIFGYENNHHVYETMLRLMSEVTSISQTSPIKFRLVEFLDEAIYEQFATFISSIFSYISPT